MQDLISPLEWSLASTSIADAYGFTTLPHLRDMAITGPFDVTGVSRDAEPRSASSRCQPDTEPQQVVVRARDRVAPRLAGVPAAGRPSAI